MDILIVGAGVIGLTSAYNLLRDGHKVTLIDRNDGPAKGASRANGGFLSASSCAPWAMPGLMKMAVRSQFDRDAAFSFRPDFSWQQVRWGLDVLKQSTAERFAINRDRMIKLGILSRRTQEAMEQEIVLRYERRQAGVMHLYHSVDAAAKAGTTRQYLTSQGFNSEFLEPEAVLELEPALEHQRASLAGALYIVDEASGDCNMFCRQLMAHCQTLGAQFRWNATVSNVQVNGELNTVTGLQLSSGETLTADAYVMATGAEVAELLRPYFHVPVYPIKGYSMTVPVSESEQAPQRALVDDRSQLAIVRLDRRVRVAGFAEMVGFDRKLHSHRCKQLASGYADLYPRGGNTADAKYWTGLRPMTPDGTPIIGATPLDNLYLNTGHGTYGWTLSCGSARLLADVISRRTPSLDINDYQLARY